MRLSLESVSLFSADFAQFSGPDLALQPGPTPDIKEASLSRLFPFTFAIRLTDQAGKQEGLVVEQEGLEGNQGGWGHARRTGEGAG
jgi:hypothetical protein